MSAYRRDLRLDTLRALAMMWVLCVILTGYWLGLASEPWRSAMLFEMPAIFFIAGASQQYVDLHRPFTRLLASRWTRVMRPFINYAAACIALAAAWWGIHLLCPSFGAPHTWQGVRHEAANVLLLCAAQDTALLPYQWHLWFIVPYIILSLAFPMQVRLLARIRGGFALAMAADMAVTATFGLWPTHPCATVLRQAVLYNLFMLAGYRLYSRLSRAKTALTFIASCISLIICDIQGGANAEP